MSLHEEVSGTASIRVCGESGRDKATRSLARTMGTGARTMGSATCLWMSLWASPLWRPFGRKDHSLEGGKRWVNTVSRAIQLSIAVVRVKAWTTEIRGLGDRGETGLSLSRIRPCCEDQDCRQPGENRFHGDSFRGGEDPSTKASTLSVASLPYPRQDASRIDEAKQILPGCHPHQADHAGEMERRLAPGGTPALKYQVGDPGTDIPDQSVVSQRCGIW